MRVWLKYILLFFIGLLTSSCQHEDLLLEENVGETSISFTLQLGNSNSSVPHTRVGDNFETMVDEKMMHVLIYDAKKYVGNVENIKLFSVDDATTGIYTFKGEVKKDVKLEPGKEYRFMVLANCAFPSDPQKNAVYDASVLVEPSGKIPMWGLTTYKITKDQKQNLNSISLIRAAAKVEIRLTSELSDAGYKLTKVFVDKAATKGYIFPKGWESRTTSNGFPDNFSPEQEEVLESYFQPYGPSAEVKDFQLLDGGNLAKIFLLEYDNKSNSANPAQITVVLKDKAGVEQTHTVQFMNYENGNPVDETLCNIIRNVNYKFTITRIGYELSLIANVKPWDVSEETWDYTDQITIREEGQLKWTKGTYANLNEETATVVLTPGKILHGEFMIDTPKGSQWFATFVPLTGLNNAFLFKINGKKTASGEVGKLAKLDIEPVHTDITKNNAAVLRIVVVTPDGRSFSVDKLFKKKEYTVIQPK